MPIKKKRLHLAFCLCLLLLGVVACGKNRAGSILTEAENLIEQQEYDKALCLLDSLDRNYPGEISTRKEALKVRKKLYADQFSLRLSEIPSQLDSLRQLEENLRQRVKLSSNGDEYYPIDEQINSLPQRGKITLRLKCDTLGFATIEVIYFGTKLLHYESLAFDFGDSIVQSKPYPLGSALNYTSMIDQDHYQILTIPPRDSQKLLHYLGLLPQEERLNIALLSRKGNCLYKEKLSYQKTLYLKSLAQFADILQKQYDLRQEIHRKELYLHSKDSLH